MFPDELPHDRRGYALIIVPQHVADAGYLRPRDYLVSGFDRIGQATAGFRDDLDAAFDQPLFLPIQFEGFERHSAEHGAYAPDRLDDVREPRSGRTLRHQNTGTAFASMRSR